MDLRERSSTMNYSEYDERDEVVLREVVVDEDGRALPALEQAGMFFFSNFVFSTEIFFFMYFLSFLVIPGYLIFFIFQIRPFKQLANDLTQEAEDA